MAKKKLKITLDDGSTVKVKVLATYGCLILHAHIADEDKTTITHAPTGRRVMSVSSAVPHKDIAPFLRRLSDALEGVKADESISGETGRKALPWIDLIRATERVYVSLAEKRTYIPVNINKPKSQRVYSRPLPMPTTPSLPSLVAA